MSNPAEVRSCIERLYREGSVRGDDGAVRSIRPLALTPQLGAFLRELCRRSNAQTLLEIGLAWGLSSLHLEEALLTNHAPPRSHVIIDPFQASEFDNAALASIRDLGLEYMIEFHQEYSELVLPMLIKQERVFDFVFIDGNHRFDGVFIDAVLSDRLLRPGGLMVFDDAWSDGVFLACRFVETNFGYQLLSTYPQVRPGRPNRRPFRGEMRAYAKPQTSRKRGHFELTPFYDRVRIGEGLERSLRTQGIAALRKGDRSAAREAFTAALRIKRRPKTYLRLLRTYLPITWARTVARQI